MCTMQNEVEFGFPAGDESDGSIEEWDIGYSLKKTERQNIPASGPEEDPLSVLKTAVSNGDVQVVQQLMDSGMAVETRLGFEWTLLMCAVHLAHYELAKLLLDRGASANFSKDQFTVLMAACTASAPEDDVAKCVELLLSRNADPNAYNNSGMTSLMMAARDGYSQVINLLVSHGAEVNAQDSSGYTALAMAVQYGQEGAVLKLIHLGADKSTRTKAGKSPVDLAKIYKQTQISRILTSPGGHAGNGEVLSKEESLFRFLKQKCEPPANTNERSTLCDIELLLHGLNLEYLSDVLLENDITWSCLSVMEKEDLEKVGITDLEDQKMIQRAVKEMHLDRVDLDTFNQLESFDSSEELYSFLISLRQQCSYLTETVQDIVNKFPTQASELVLSMDPKRESRVVCSELVAQTGDLQKEVACLANLLDKMSPVEDPCQLPPPTSNRGWKRWVLVKFAVGVLGAGFLFLLSLAKNPKIVL